VFLFCVSIASNEAQLLGSLLSQLYIFSFKKVESALLQCRHTAKRQDDLQSYNYADPITSH